MKQKTENFLTYTVFAFITLGSFLGIAYQLANPEIYTEMMKNNYMIPVVQNHIEINDTCPALGFIVSDNDLTRCKNELPVV